MRLKTLLAQFLLIIAVCACSAATADIGIVVNPAPVLQGRTFVVKVFGDDSVTGVTAEVFGLSVPFFRYSDCFIALVGVPLGTSPQRHNLHITVSTEAGPVKYDRFVTVKKGSFEKVSFRLKPSKSKLLAADVIEDGWAKIYAEVVKSSPKKLWVGSFRRPTIGLVSMGYGARQFINGVQRDQHKGLDIAGMSNYRIRAANYGMVVLAEWLAAFGRTVVIDHGLGVYSLYFHMSRIDVKKGDPVAKGQILGLMGMTGVATGVHLHFAMSVNDVRVDPVQWMNTVVVQ